MSAEKRLRELGIQLHQPGLAQGKLELGVIHNGLLFLSGQGTLQPDGSRFTGKLGRERSIREGYAAARIAGLNLLSVIRMQLGSLDHVTRIIKVLGMVNADDDFRDHPKVIDGCSELFIDVFGDKGKHARSAIGMGSLPNGISVEIEAIVAFDESTVGKDTVFDSEHIDYRLQHGY